MPRSHSRTTSAVRVHEGSGEEDSALIRWIAQLLVGGLPGGLICLVIMWMASKPSAQGPGTHIASIVPLLSANGLADSPAFHRIKFERSDTAGGAPQYKMPPQSSVPVAGCSLGNAVPASAGETGAPRTAWKYMTARIRSQVDAGLSLHPSIQQIVLHGSGVNHGNAGLLNRYHGTVRGLAQGLSYHFVIGNGVGSPDGLIELGSRWLNRSLDNEPKEKAISICFVGDFNEQKPSDAQMAALHELMDYLAIKVGPLDITTHRMDDGSPSSCLGVHLATLGATAEK